MNDRMPNPLPPSPSVVGSGSMHPTKERLLQAVLHLMQTWPLERITADMVLETAGVSKGSMYHHFQDFAQLVEEVLVARFAAGVDLTIAAVEQIARQCQDCQEAVIAMRVLTAEMNGPSRARMRFERARLLGSAQENSRWKRRLAQEQSRLTDGLAALFIEFQQKGWARKDVDPRAAAVLIQAYTLGKVVDDIVDDPMSEAAWNDLINKVVETVLVAPAAN